MSHFGYDKTQTPLATKAPSPLFTGTQVNYSRVCSRKLWLFST